MNKEITIECYSCKCTYKKALDDIKSYVIFLQCPNCSVPTTLHFTPSLGRNRKSCTFAKKIIIKWNDLNNRNKTIVLLKNNNPLFKNMKLKELLDLFRDKNHIEFCNIRHNIAYAAEENAESLGLSVEIIWEDD